MVDAEEAKIQLDQRRETIDRLLDFKGSGLGTTL